jgi:hypothetical protein
MMDSGVKTGMNLDCNWKGLRGQAALATCVYLSNPRKIQQIDPDTPTAVFRLDRVDWSARFTRKIYPQDFAGDTKKRVID